MRRTPLALLLFAALVPALAAARARSARADEPPPPAPVVPPASAAAPTPQAIPWPAPRVPECLTMCEHWTLTPRARTWWAVPAGDHVKITLGGEPGTGTDVDTDRDMGLDGALAWEVGADVAYGRHRVRLAYESIAVDGTNRLDRNVTFHGVTYAAGETVDSEIDLRLWKASYDYDLLRSPCDALRVGAGAWVWTFEGRMDGSIGPETTRDFTHVYPVVTVDAEKRLGRWAIGAGATFGMLATDRYVLDLEAHGGLRIGGRAEIDLGYRVMRFAFHETTNEGDLVFHGPFAEVSFDL